VRNHTATPAIDMGSYRLALSGSGLRRGAVSFSLAGLERMPARTITAAIECAGNGRSYAKALDDALLAYEMNGRDLPPDHVRPARRR
jgi:DMSO/TMAO reductase YedYZ molybdopterin-dependent catalytic subunit